MQTQVAAEYLLQELQSGMIGLSIGSMPAVHARMESTSAESAKLILAAITQQTQKTKTELAKSNPLFAGELNEILDQLQVDQSGSAINFTLALPKFSGDSDKMLSASTKIELKK
jgi:hypothetical protein